MPSVSTVLRKDKINKKGKAPIAFYVINNRKLTKVSTGIMIDPKFWDEGKSLIRKGEKNSARLNAYLASKRSEIIDSIFESDTKPNSLSEKQLKDKIYGKKPINFFEFGDKVCDVYKEAGQIGSYHRCKSILNKVETFLGSRILNLQDIDVQFLMKYEKDCRTTLSNKTNTVHKDFKFIRKMFNDAYRQDLIEHNQNPFLKYQLKQEKTDKIFLTEDELSKIENLSLSEGTRMALHRDMFVFACYAGGLRVSDVLQLKWKNFDGTYLLLTIKKTSEQLQIKLPNKAIEIINRNKAAKPDPNSFIFPILDTTINLNDPENLDRVISGANAYINKNLKLIAEKTEINKNISFHTSRHTWATRALRLGVSIDKVSKLMGHAQIRETMVYAKIVNSELDKAMDVFN
jgi:integrase